MTKLLSDPENVHSADIHGLRQSPVLCGNVWCRCFRCE
jgi:hypothetical protein